MSELDPLLEVRFDGSAIGPGKIPVSHLTIFLNNLNKVIERTWLVLYHDSNSTQLGSVPQNTKKQLELSLVSLTHGSPAAVLGFTNTYQSEAISAAESPTSKILEKALNGLHEVQTDKVVNQPLSDYGTKVLEALSDTGNLFNKGIDKIGFTLNQKEKPIECVLTDRCIVRIKKLLEKPGTSVQTVEGRLLMADFKDQGTRCRIHPSIGDPIPCTFIEEQKDEVYAGILKFVRITGEATLGHTPGQIYSIKIDRIEQLENQDSNLNDLFSDSVPVSRTFWQSPTLDELIHKQNAEPIADVRTLYGTWPGEDDDGFEEAVNELRHPELKRGS